MLGVEGLSVELRNDGRHNGSYHRILGILCGYHVAIYIAIS